MTAAATDKRNRSTRLAAAIAGLALVAACACQTVPVGNANAVTYTTAPVDAGEEAASLIQTASTEFEEAQRECLKVGVRGYALQKRIDVLEDMLPQQQERSDGALRQLYKTQSDPLIIVDMFLEAGSLRNAIQLGEYLDKITQANLDTINEARALHDLIEEGKGEIQAIYDEAEARRAAASEALEAAYAERTEKQRSGIANAQSQGAGMAGQTMTVDEGDGSKGSSDKKDEKSKKTTSEPLTSDTASLDDGADWHSTEEEFVAEWAPRLDAYLAGSALAGQGKNFAKSAWKYCIDPRWSAAISCIESGKGAACIRPHNAWGWGAADVDPYNLASEWGSWEEAIDTHAKGLANGYGYTLTAAGAQAYCPVNWVRWYNWTLSEMASI